jgi:hypothetical protein
MEYFTIPLGLVDNLSSIGYFDQSRQAEWAADHVLYQSLDTRLVPRGQKHGLVNAKTTVLPRSHILHDFRFDLTLAQIQGKHGLLPGHQQTVHVKLRQIKKFAFRGVSPTGHERMDMWIPVSAFIRPWVPW